MSMLTGTPYLLSGLAGPALQQDAEGGMPVLAWVLIVIIIVLAIWMLWWWIASTRRKEEPPAKPAPPVVRAAEPPRAPVAAAQPPAQPAPATVKAVEPPPAPVAAAMPPAQPASPAVMAAESPPAPVAAAEPPVAPAPAPVKPDDLTIIEGIGPKIAGVLQAAGIKTFAQLAAADASHLDRILKDAGLTLADPRSWGEQAGLAAAGKWDELKVLTDGLKGGRRV